MPPRERPTKVLTPSGWMPRGEATADVRGRRVLIWKGIPGEAAKVELVGRGQHQDHARFVTTREPHPTRRRPPCDKMDQCGGCPLMHMTEAGQHDARLWLTRSALASVGLEEHAPTEVVPSPDGDEGYRHVLKLEFGYNDVGHIRVGAYGRHSHRIIPIPECRVAHPEAAQVMRTIAHHVIELDVRPYDEARERGLLRHVIVRRSRSNGQILVTYIANYNTRLLRELAERVTQDAGMVAGSWLHINEHPGNAMFAPIDPEVDFPFMWLGGAGEIEEEIAGVALRIGPGDFFQANPGTADRLVRDVVSSLAEHRARPIVDLYCGVGTFTLPLAKAHGWALGVEVVPSAVKRAEESARRLHLPARFLRGTVSEELPTVEKRLAGKSPVVVVDPARRGLEPDVHEAIARLKPARLVYVSCNPKALARDLEILKKAGWNVDRIRAYDMFPQTSHVELLAELAPAEVPEQAGRGPRRRVVR